MPPNDSPQPADSTAAGPGGLITNPPQASPATDQGPDSARLPRTIPGSERALEETYKERIAGQDRRYNEDKRKWDTERQDLTKSLQALQEQVQALTKQANAPEGTPQPKPRAPVSDGKPSGATTTVEALDQALAQRKAVQYRDSLLEEYTQAGAPGEGLPLEVFRDRIQVVVPEINADGTLNDKPQRQEIEFFISALKGIQGDTRKATQDSVLAGQTPGSAPAPPAPAGDDGDQKLIDEYHTLMETMPLVDDKAEYTQMEARLMELGDNPIIARSHSGRTRPGMNHEQHGDAIRELQEQMQNMLQGQAVRP